MVQAPINLNSCTKEEIQTFLASFDTVLTDCDGVLWLKNDLIEDSEKTINKFLQLNKKLFYVTNDNSLTREEYVEKCKRLGFNAIKDNIICTSFLAADYLKNINFDKKVYVVGSEGIIKELDKLGIKHTDIGPDPIDTNLEVYIQKDGILDPEVGAVLLGFDQYISYPKIMKAGTYLKDPNCHFVATCCDETYPEKSKDNLVFPDTGCFIKCLEAVSTRHATVLGKPNDYIKNYILKQHDIDPSRTIMIGDRCNTDMMFGNKCGFKTLLVLTGVTALSDLENYAKSAEKENNGLLPQFYVNKLGDLLQYM